MADLSAIAALYIAFTSTCSPVTAGTATNTTLEIDKSNQVAELSENLLSEPSDENIEQMGQYLDIIENDVAIQQILESNSVISKATIVTALEKSFEANEAYKIEKEQKQAEEAQAAAQAQAEAQALAEAEAKAQAEAQKKAELSAKYGDVATILNKSFENALAGKGQLFAEYCAEKGVDPFLAAAIAIHESYRGSSNMITNQNNVGGMRVNGVWLTFSSIDEGIKRFINNIAKNYVAYGLTTPESMSQKYANSDSWGVAVRKFYDKIKSGQSLFNGAELNPSLANSKWL